MIAFHGTADEYVPCDGGHGPMALAPIANHSVAYAMDFWRRTDGCTPIPQRATQGATVHDAYAGCTGTRRSSSTPCRAAVTPGPPGAWPGGPPPTPEISAGRLRRAFFAAHSRP